MADWLENIAVEKKGKARIINIGTFIKEVMEWERCSGSYLMEKAPLLRFLGLYRFLLQGIFNNTYQACKVVPK